MAWYVTGQNLTMAEGDYGIALPITITGVTLGERDSIRITLKTGMNGTVILEKEFSDISENTVTLEFTDAETELFPVGAYVYALDWYQDGSFMCNIIPCASLKVVDKA